ncbi:MAG TPA: aldo/keto reductase [Rhodothermales bacterium]|nr:aldo/keto reductase [Bacteroidota bacterium]HRK74209.1 aldo/keto reductase [Rhodothermales bacterium]HRR09580.1 aldo/keto reductase [Rhodothermales bacterium]
MQYKLLGHSGLRVSEIALGTMTFGTEWSWGANYETSKAQFEAFAKCGGNFIDTANRYTEGTSERFVGEFIQSDRNYWVVATKYTLFNRLGDPNAAGNHRKNLVQSLEASLRRLGTDYVDVLYLHAWDALTPIEEVMRALDYLVRAGKVLYIAISDTPAWIVAQGNTLAQWRGWSPFIGLQVEYSLLQRTPERDLLPMANAMGLGVAAWAPLAGGALTGKYLKNADENGRVAPKSARRSEQANHITQAVVDVADKLGVSAAQIATNWVRQHQQTIIPIVGARTLSQLEDSLGCLNFKIPDAELAFLNEVSAIDLGFPHDFLSTPAIQNIVYAGMRDRIID